jgi:hypothetical protein
MRTKMKIFLTLSEVSDRCYDWEDFCEAEGWSVWAVNEGGGDVEVALSEEQAKLYGIIRTEEDE